MKKTIISIVGARPNFIKLAALSPELRRHFDEVIIHTGQHYDESMSGQFFDRLDIPKPDYNLAVGSGTQAEQLGWLITAIGNCLDTKTLAGVPVIVYGDTNSTFAGALVARRTGHPVIHVEAGLRSFDIRMPEEQNRLMIDALADIKFCPTPTAYLNLKLAGQQAGASVPGDLHATLFNRVYAPTRKMPKVQHHILCTIHRPENTDNPNNLDHIVEALRILGKTWQVIWPVHPRTMKAMQQQSRNGVFLLSNDMRLEGPKGYLEMLDLIDRASLVITDSGGVQKEAWFCQTPCLTIRGSTEWPETLVGGWNRLVSPNYQDIVKEAVIIANSAALVDQDRQLFGLNGNPAKAMAEKLATLHG